MVPLAINGGLDDPALVVAGVPRIPYHQLHELPEQTANDLAALGICRGDRITC